MCKKDTYTEYYSYFCGIKQTHLAPQIILLEQQST